MQCPALKVESRYLKQRLLRILPRRDASLLDRCSAFGGGPPSQVDATKDWTSLALCRVFAKDISHDGSEEPHDGRELLTRVPDDKQERGDTNNR